MTILRFSPMTYTALARQDSPHVSYSICPFIDVYALSIGVDGKMTELGTYHSAHHAAIAAMEHWQEQEELIVSALPGEPVKIASKCWATIPDQKTVVVPAAEMKRRVAENLMAHDIGGEA